MKNPIWQLYLIRITSYLVSMTCINHFIEYRARISAVPTGQFFQLQLVQKSKIDNIYRYKHLYFSSQVLRIRRFRKEFDRGKTVSKCISDLWTIQMFTFSQKFERPLKLIAREQQRWIVYNSSPLSMILAEKKPCIFHHSRERHVCSWLSYLHNHVSREGVSSLYGVGCYFFPKKINFSAPPAVSSRTPLNITWQ